MNDNAAQTQLQELPNCITKAEAFELWKEVPASTISDAITLACIEYNKNHELQFSKYARTLTKYHIKILIKDLDVPKGYKNYDD